MLKHRSLLIYRVLKYLIASVWLINGLFCKILNLTPRHTQIVAAIFNTSHARSITIVIGFSEILVAVWIVSERKAQWAAFIQMLIIASMNIIEWLLVPGLLLWGRFNILFAFLLILFIYYHQFILGKKIIL